MKFFAYLKKLNKLGVAMTEYAVLLAFVAAIGASFTSDSGLGNSISGAVNKAVEAIGLVSGEKQASVKGKMDKLLADFLAGAPLKNPQTQSGLRKDSLAAELASGGDRFLEDYLKNAGIDTLYAFDSIYTNDRLDALKAAGVIAENAKNVKLLTVANENGLSFPNQGPISATQYLFCQEGSTMKLVATRNLDSIYNISEGGHTINGSYTQSGVTETYNRTKNIKEAKYMDNGVELKINQGANGFVLYNK